MTRVEKKLVLDDFFVIKIISFMFFEFLLKLKFSYFFFERNGKNIIFYLLIKKNSLKSKRKRKRKIGRSKNGPSLACAFPFFLFSSKYKIYPPPHFSPSENSTFHNSLSLDLAKVSSQAQPTVSRSIYPAPFMHISCSFSTRSEEYSSDLYE